MIIRCKVGSAPLAWFGSIGMTPAAISAATTTKTRPKQAPR